MSEATGSRKGRTSRPPREGARRAERDEISTAREAPPERELLRSDRPRAPLGKLGRYQLLFEIARGGMGTVYAARLSGAHGFDRLVAIKRLRTDEATESDRVALLDEARLTAKITHPNVVQTIELGEEDESPFLVMQLIEGVSLARLLAKLAQRKEYLDPTLAAWIALQAALGLHAAHELQRDDGGPLGLVHRDVSPENLLLSFAGRVHVADFGIAKILDAERATRKGVLKGKFAYMSPEHVKGETLDRRSDVFALGIVLYESLVGKRLFAGASAADTIRRVLDERPGDPREVRPELPSSLVAIALRCLEKDSMDRYASAAEVADALRAALRELGRGVDESDLAAILERVCAEEKETLRGKIRGALAREEPTPAPEPGSATERSVIAPMTMGAGASPSDAAPPLARAERRPRWMIVSAVLAALTGIAIGAVVVRSSSSAKAGDSRPSSSVRLASGTPTIAPSIAEPSPPTTAQAAPSASASTEIRPPLPGLGDATARPNANPLPSPRHTASAAAPPKPPPNAGSASVKGVPFDSLGP